MTLRKETKIGIVVLVALVLLYIGFNFLKGIYIFEKPKIYYSVYQKINGLQTSNPVMINGYKVGQVKDIDILKDGTGKLLVTLMVYEDVDIPKDSKALLKPGDLLGSMQLNLILGKSLEIAQEGDTLIPEISGDLFEEVNEQLRPFKIKAKTLLNSVDSVLQVIEVILNAESQQNIVESFKGVNAAVANLERTTFRIDTLVREERERISLIFQNVEELTDILAKNGGDLDNIISNFSQISDSIAKADIASTIRNADSALNEVNQIVEKINQGEGSLGMLINNPGLYNRLDSAANNLDLLVEDLRINPSRYVQFSVFGRKNKNVELTKKEMEQLKEYIKETEAAGQPE